MSRTAPSNGDTIPNVTVPNPNRRSTNSRIKYSCWTKLFALLLSLISYLILAVNMILYCLYFILWENVLRTSVLPPGLKINKIFFDKVALVLFPMEALMVLSITCIVLCWYHCLVLKCMKMSARHPIVVATATYIVAAVFGAANLGFYAFHELILEETLECQVGDFRANLTEAFMKSGIDMLNGVTG